MLVSEKRIFTYFAKELHTHFLINEKLRDKYLRDQDSVLTVIKKRFSSQRFTAHRSLFENL